MGLVAEVSTALRWHSLPPAWVLVLVVIPAVLLTVRFMYRREAGDLSTRWRLAMGILRSAAILLALAAFFGPYAESIEGEYFKRHLILCIDTSRSMDFRDGYASDPELASRIREACALPPGADLSKLGRLDIVKALIGADPAYIEKLADKFRLHIYTFDASTTGRFEERDEEPAGKAAKRFLAALPRLRAAGGVTRIGGALHDLVRAFDAKNEPVAGILLFSDGRQTGGAPAPIEEARRAAEGTREGIPVFPVAIGDPAAAVNIGVSRVDAPEVALAGDEVAFTVTVHARGLEGRLKSVEAVLLDADSKVKERLPIEAEPFELPGDDAPPIKVSFRHRFDRPGRYNLRIGVPPDPVETVKGDNYQRHVLRVVKLKMRVLFVASKPNYTYRFLKEALFRASGTIDAQVLLLSAEPEWPQEASRHVQPIRVFPRQRRELSKMDVIILMDVDPADRRMTGGGAQQRDEVLKRIAAWVKQGGGLVLHAGRDGNVPDAYLDTPLMPLLPVVPFRGMNLNTSDRIVELAKRKRYRLTQAGSTHPIMRVLRDPNQVRAFWESGDYATYYYWYAPVERAKSSAAVLAVRRDEDETGPACPSDPLIAVQNYGLGKVLWLGTDELWRMRRRVENLYYWRFWAGAIRYLATYRLLGGNKRIKIWVDRDDGRYQVGDTIQVEAKFLDENFEPVVPDPAAPDKTTRTIRLRTPAGEEQPVTLQALVTDPPEGLFSTRLAAGRPGTYSLIADPGSSDEEPAERTFVVEDTTLENRDPLMDMRTLQGIAEASRGRVLKPHQFHDLLAKEIVRPTGIVRSGEPRRTDLWDRAWVLWLFVGLLAVEWILRRLKLLL